MSAYTKRVAWDFEVCGELIAITGFDETGVEVEELRKNGQEDCHMWGQLGVDADGVFAWEEGEESFVTYDSQELADGIAAYLTKHGLPKEENQ